MLEGVDHVLLCDNGGSDNSREVLRPWVDASFVDLCDWPLHWKRGAQTKAFEDALIKLRGRTRWAAFIDVDEYLFSPTGAKVVDALRPYEDHAGVIVNWQCYGVSGHKRRPDGLTIECYTRRARTNWARNRRVKTIVDPSLAVEPQSAHLFRGRDGHALSHRRFQARERHSKRQWPPPAAAPSSLAAVPAVRSLFETEPSIRRVSVSNLGINHSRTGTCASGTGGLMRATTIETRWRTRSWHAGRSASGGHRLHTIGRPIGRRAPRL